MSESRNRAQVSAYVKLSNLVIEEYLAMLDTPRSLAVCLLYTSGDHNQLLDLDLPHDIWDHVGGIAYVRNSHAATKLLQKSSFLNLAIDRKEVALAGGLACEQMNRETNRRLSVLREYPMTDSAFNSVLHGAARIVSQIVGPFPDALRMIEDFGWTPGRTSAVNSRHLSHIEKYQASLDSSSGALSLARKLVNSSPLWAMAALAADGPVSLLPGAFRVVNHNTAMTVPKNAKTDRLICYEPHINIRLQRSVGAYLSRRIRLSTGIDLSDQSPNQRAARIGSKTGRLATIDLSSASDTLCYQLVLDLLPIDWFDFLDRLRSRYTLWPFGLSLNEKFSSMGNGFTFELETIVFYSICKAVARDDILVYGDDIVIPSQHYENVVSALGKAGFTVNSRKSFSTGSFRESCGEEFYAGVSITAPRMESRDSVMDIVKFHNRVFEWFQRGSACTSAEFSCLKRWRKSVNALLRQFGEKSIPLGPQGLGDGHFYSNFDEALPSRHPHGWDGYVYYSMTELVRYDLPTSLDHQKRGRKFLSSPQSCIAAALGPRAPLELERCKPFRVSGKRVRSRLFSKEWPSVIVVA